MNFGMINIFRISVDRISRYDPDNLLHPLYGRWCGPANHATQVALGMHYNGPSLHTPPTCAALHNHQHSYVHHIWNNSMLANKIFSVACWVIAHRNYQLLMHKVLSSKKSKNSYDKKNTRSKFSGAWRFLLGPCFLLCCMKNSLLSMSYFYFSKQTSMKEKIHVANLK